MVCLFNTSTDDAMLPAGTPLMTGEGPTASVSGDELVVGHAHAQLVVPDPGDLNWLEQFHLADSDLSLPQQAKVRALLREFSDCVSTFPSDLGYCRATECHIDTGDYQPIKLPYRRTPPAIREAVSAKIENFRQRGIIQDSVSPWSSPVVVVKKKDGSLRICLDYRKINDITWKDAYPLPDATQMLEELAGSSWFCTLDLTTGYMQDTNGGRQ